MARAISGSYHGNHSEGIAEIDWWANVAQTLIDAGANLHVTREYARWPSIYVCILNSACTPSEADYYLCHWLDILANVGVSIRPYIERERENVVLGFGAWPGRRLTTTIYRGDIPIPSWQWVKDPAGPAFTLLDTFDFLRDDRRDRSLVKPEEYLLAPDPYLTMLSFPFHFRSYYRISIDDRDAGRRPFKTVKQIAELKEQRFARRIEKKRRKECKGRPSQVHQSGAKDTDTLKIPGSWVD